MTKVSKRKQVQQPTLIFYPNGDEETLEIINESKTKLSKNIHWYSPLKSLGEAIITVIALFLFALVIGGFINFIL